MKIKSLINLILVVILLAGCNIGANITQTINSSEDTMLANATLTNTTITKNLNLSGKNITSSYEQNGILYIGTNMGLYVSQDNGSSWTITNPKDTGLVNTNYIYDVAADGNTIYILVDNNSFGNYTLVSKDNGKTWQHFGTNYEDATSIFLVGHDLYLVYGGYYMHSPNTTAVIKVSHDQGDNWTTIASFTNISYILSLYIDKSDMDNIYFIDPSANNIYGSKDGGKTWVVNFSPYENKQLTSVAARNNSVFVSTTDGVLFSSEWLAYGTNCGSNITCGAEFGTTSPLTTENGLGSNYVYKLAYDTINDKLIAATKNGYSVTADISSTFIPIFTNVIPSIHNDLPSSQVNTTFINEDVIIIGTDNGISIYNNTINLGLHVASESSCINILSIATYNNSIYYTGYQQGLTIEKNQSITKKVTYTGNNNGLYDSYSLNTFIANESNIYVGSLGGLSISHDGGNTWIYKSIADGVSAAVNSVVANAKDIYLATYGSGLLISHDDGNTWSKGNISATDGLVYKVFINNETIYVGTYEYGLYMSTDQGNTWKHYLISTTIKDIFVVGKNIYIAAADGIYVSTDNGGSWSHNFAGDVKSIYAAAGNIYAGLSNGSIVISLDNGKTYSFNINTNTSHINAIYQAFGNIILGNPSTTVYGAYLY